MKKRLRKKKHLGEFAEHGFIVTGRSDPTRTSEQHNAFVDEVLRFVESKNLGVAGNVAGPAIDFYVARLCRRPGCTRCNRMYGRDRQMGNVTNDDRETLVAWYEAHGGKVVAGPLFDAYYHSEAEFEAATPRLA